MLCSISLLVPQIKLEDLLLPSISFPLYWNTAPDIHWKTQPPVISCAVSSAARDMSHVGLKLCCVMQFHHLIYFFGKRLKIQKDLIWLRKACQEFLERKKKSLLCPSATVVDISFK